MRKVLADADAAWTALLAARATTDAGEMAGEQPRCEDSEGQQLLDLHWRLATAGPGGQILAQLGQSLDGRIATESGHSHFVTGDENRDHLHRLRALCDAVVVGIGTVTADDPQLTVRRASGPNPLRVVLDPRRGLSPDHKVFQDGAAPTLVLCAPGKVGQGRHGLAEVAEVATDREGRLSPSSIIEALRARGCRRILVEGGGVTISRFLQAGVIDRLQIAVAPIIIGSGRPGLTLAPIERLDTALRPRIRHYPMGGDLLFDCCFRQ